MIDIFLYALTSILQVETCPTNKEATKEATKEAIKEATGMTTVEEEDEEVVVAAGGVIGTEVRWLIVFWCAISHRSICSHIVTRVLTTKISFTCTV